MRIGLCTTSFPRFEGDVAGSFVLGFARALVERGHEIVVLAPEPASGDAPPSWPGITVRWVPYVRPRSWARTFYGAGVPENLRHDPRAWLGLAPFSWALRRRASDDLASCDALVSHWALPSALAAGGVRGERPHLAVLHSADVHALRELPMGGSLARKVARGATGLLFVTERHRDVFLSLLPPLERAKVASRCHVSAMGIEPLASRGSRRDARRRLGLERFTVLSMGRLVPIKGLDHLVAALAGHPSWELAIAGEGPERDRLARLASRRGARARFVGVVSGDRKADLLRGADAYVLPSIETRTGRSEGMPTSVLEAMLAKLPVVASDTGGIGAVLEHGRNALLLPPGRSDAIAAALEQLAGDASLRRRLGRAAHVVAKRYVWSELAPRIEALLATDAR